MESLTLEKDLLLVALLRQWAESQGIEDQLCTFMTACIEQRKNPFVPQLSDAMRAAAKAFASYMPNCNGHKTANRVSAHFKVPATIEAPPETKSRVGLMDGLEEGDTIQPAVHFKSASEFRIDSGHVKRMTRPNITRAWLQQVPAGERVTGKDIMELLERNARGFLLLPAIQKQAAVDNVAYALRNQGIIEWQKKGNKNRKSKFFKTEKIGRKSTNSVIQIYLDGGIPTRRGRKIKRKAKAKAE